MVRAFMDKEHPMTAPQPTRDYITIVSGLPRSGTSMAMAALAGGGIEPLIDHVREADEDNPRGYYEFERVKKVREDTLWLEEAKGKVVKMVYKLLYDLPAQYQYRVVFMRRHLSEVLASQNKMLERNGKTEEPVHDMHIRSLFTTELYRCTQWLAKQPNFEVLYIKHRGMIHHTAEEVEKISAFLNGGLDTAAMAAVVDHSLYRNRNA